LSIFKPAIAMGAHNPLAAKLVADTGFDAVWVSSLEVSASYAVPDASIISTSVPLELTRAMREVQPLPIVIDMDTGYGNAVNVAYATPRLEAAGAAAVVLEDKTFPKLNSLRADARQDLVSIDEFQGKIAAAKASSNMLVIARIEALIAGLGQAEALKRGEAYVDAGADAVLIHSKQKTPGEILDFCRAWRADVPLVLVPTSYPSLSFADIAELNKVGLIICANQGLRAAVAGMRRTFQRILEDGKLEGAEAEIVPDNDIFALQGDDDVRMLEGKYLR
jgi:phosphonopyruvate hydrolase